MDSKLRFIIAKGYKANSGKEKTHRMKLRESRKTLARVLPQQKHRTGSIFQQQVVATHAQYVYCVYLVRKAH